MWSTLLNFLTLHSTSAMARDTLDWSVVFDFCILVIQKQNCICSRFGNPHPAQEFMNLHALASVIHLLCSAYEGKKMKILCNRMSFLVWRAILVEFPDPPFMLTIPVFLAIQQNV